MLAGSGLISFQKSCNQDSVWHQVVVCHSTASIVTIHYYYIYARVLDTCNTYDIDSHCRIATYFSLGFTQCQDINRQSSVRMSIMR